MGIFHKEVNERLIRHIEELKKLGALPKNWAWHKEQVRKLARISKKLAEDIHKAHTDSLWSLNINEFSSAVKTLENDLRQMLGQTGLLATAQEREAEIVNKLLERIKLLFAGYPDDERKKSARINRIKHTMEEIRIIFDDKYPEYKGLLDIDYEQVDAYSGKPVKVLSAAYSRNEPAYRIFFRRRAKPEMSYTIIQLLRPDIDEKVAIKDLRQRYQLEGMLSDAVNRTYRDAEPLGEMQSLVRQIFHEALMIAADNRAADLYSEKTLEKAYNDILFKEADYMRHDNSALLQIVKRMLPGYDSHKQEWIIVQVCRSYSISQEDAEVIYIHICELIQEDLLARKKQGEEVHWKTEVKKAAESDKTMLEAVRLYEQEKGDAGKSAARADEEKIRWIAFLFRNRLKVIMRYGRFPDYAFDRLEDHLEPQWREKGIEP